MKKLSKILIAIAASLVIMVTPVVLVGCNKTESMSVAQVNELVANSAKNFYSNHTETSENFAAITYHWNQNAVEKTMTPVEYKETAEATETVTRDYEFVSTSVTDYKVAVKKDGDNLVAQFTIDTTETSNEYGTNENQTLKTITETVHAVETYRVVAYTEEETTKYVLIYEKSEQVDDGEVTYVKQYQTLSNADALATQVNVVLNNANKEIRNEFFRIAGEAIIYYSSLITAEKTGNDVKISLNLENIVNVSSSFTVTTMSNKANIYFTNNNISKADAYIAMKTEGMSRESTVTFDYSNAAEVNTSVNLDGYTEQSLQSDYSAVANRLSDLTDTFYD